MKPIQQFRLLGLITLVIFPLPTFLTLHFLNLKSPIEILSLHELKEVYWLLGIQLGFFYGYFVLLVTQHTAFDSLSKKQERILKSLPLTWLDVLFISFAAGFGEEILFRAGIQHWLGPWITTILFIAVHGYIHPFSIRKSLQGIVVLPFILLISFGYELYGIWFCIAAHFSYDFLLFSFLKQK